MPLSLLFAVLLRISTFEGEMLWFGLFGLQVCLEHVFHLLCNGQIDEAYQNLSLAESWRFGEQTAIQDKEMKLIQAYRGLLDYYSWSKQKDILLEHGKWFFGLSCSFSLLMQMPWFAMTPFPLLNVSVWCCGWYRILYQQ